MELQEYHLQTLLFYSISHNLSMITNFDFFYYYRDIFIWICMYSIFSSTTIVNNYKPYICLPKLLNLIHTVNMKNEKSQKLVPVKISSLKVGVGQGPRETRDGCYIWLWKTRVQGPPTVTSVSSTLLPQLR